MTDDQIEQLATALASVDRPGLVRILRSLPCRFEVDFTDEFLGSISLEQLRHIILAARLRVEAAAG